ncbi:MAG: metalloregulator ArsR/SmtB family transcription factor [Brevinematales bacterium]|nr:metalloregulator ArsR/SmtB family transcription factor [Brevinematales bacterium]
MVDYDCQCEELHENKIQKAIISMPEDNIIKYISAFFKIMGDPTRIKIINALFDNELCVCDIAEVMNMTHSAISHQLRLLREADLVKYRKEGKVVYYSLNDEHVEQLYELAKIHIIEKRGLNAKILS